MLPAKADAEFRRYRYPFTSERVLRHAILSGQRTEALQALEQMFSALGETCHSLPRLQSDAIHLMVVLIRKCFQSGAPAEGQMESVFNNAQRIIHAKSRAEVFRVVHSLTDQLLKAVRHHRLRDRRQTARLAVQYIAAHYHRGPSLEEVARMMGLSYCYFSRLFSQETGMSFQEYLTRVRLENARHLLLTTPLTVEKVAARVGYEDPSHFIRVFKRCYRMTPRRFARTDGAAAGVPDPLPVQKRPDAAEPHCAEHSPDRVHIPPAYQVGHGSYGHHLRHAQAHRDRRLPGGGGD